MDEVKPTTTLTEEGFAALLTQLPGFMSFLEGQKMVHGDFLYLLFAVALKVAQMKAVVEMQRDGVEFSFSAINEARKARAALARLVDELDKL